MSSADSHLITSLADLARLSHRPHGLRGVKTDFDAEACDAAMPDRHKASLY